MTEINQEPIKEGRMSDGTFAKGHVHNPKGKAKGCRNLATRALEKLLDGEGEEITRKCVELAKGGDLAAIRLVLERILPPRKDRTITFNLPEVNSVSDAATAMSSLLTSVAEGEISPSEAESVTKLLSFYTDALQSNELEQRLSLLESQSGLKR